MTKEIKVRKKRQKHESITNLSLLIESMTEEEFLKFDKEKISASLINELDLEKSVAEEITNEVEKRLSKLIDDTNIKVLDTSIIRSFVNTVLYEKNYSKELKSKKDIILSTYDITQIIENANTENGNLEHSPEAINFTIANRILKEYALKTIYSKDVEKAHLDNKIYIHDLGEAPTRAYCGTHSIEYLKLNGLKNIPTILPYSKSANSAWTLARHICSFTQVLGGLYAGASGWEGLNIFFAPMLIDWSKKKLKQLAQTLIFDISQLSGARGGQTAFTDFNCYINIPDYYKETYAIGKSGQYMGKTKFGKIIYYKNKKDLLYDEATKKIKILKYKDFEKESQDFLFAILSVIEEGDMRGLPFAFPKINLHINENTFTTRKLNKKEKENYDIVLDNEKNKKVYERIINDSDNVSIQLLNYACKISSKKGCPYFIFDRDGATLNSCCRLKSKVEDLTIFKRPEDIKFVGVQNVTINLPNIPLQVKQNEELFYKELDNRIQTAIKAHVQKKNHLIKIVDLKNSPLKFYKQGMNNTPYVDLEKGSYLIGLIGLNECVYNLIGKELHESTDDAYLKGLEIVSFMTQKIKQYSKDYNILLKLEETPAESACSRMAIMDVKKYGDKAFVQGKAKKNYYYTNSIHFSYKSDIDYIERLYKQSAFHSLIEAGAIIHLWTGEKNIPEKAIFNLVKKTWYETECSQWVLNPEFTCCNDCNNTFIGEYEKCPKCQSENIMGYTRITGYYVPVHKFNPGKKQERLDRNHDKYSIN